MLAVVVVVARRRKLRRNCSPTENRCCGATIIPACSRSAPTHRVKSIEIRDVERVEDTPMFGGKGQLFLVRFLGETGVRSRDHSNATKSKSRDKIAVHRVFVDVDLDLAHG